ncbi:hypothetical protein Aoki45_12300 [Algoriphagus sp. oki45]|uniref:hypothetical protein n=1 Tax=Algoriphagus sp. oki45 TaxID=3067294 RepID=UPI0027EE3121|nr:hypothetical protein Aoki45_12300 [Algoriphagus sp. oki45]
MKKLLFLIPFLIIIQSSGCGTEAVLSPMTAGSAILALDAVNSSIDDATSTVEFAVNKTINNSAAQIKSIISDLRHNILETVGDIDSKITEQQFRTLENILLLESEFESAIVNGLDGIERVSNNAGQIISDLPFTKNEPRITSVDLPFFIVDWSEKVEIKLTGYNLDDKETGLVISEKLINPTIQSSTELTFSIPKASIIDFYLGLDDSEKLSVLNFPTTLSLGYKDGFFCSRKVKELPISVKLLPRNLGKVAVVYQTDKLVDNIERGFTSTICQVTTGSSSPRRRSEGNSCSVNAPRKFLESCNNEVQGRILTNTIKINERANRYGGGASVGSVDERGFVLNVQAKSQNRPYGGGGYYAADVTFDVSYPCKVKKDEKTEYLDLFVGQDVVFDLDPNDSPLFKRAEISFFDGSSLIFDNSMRQIDFVSIFSNEAKNQVIIRPLNVIR